MLIDAEIIQKLQANDIPNRILRLNGAQTKHVLVCSYVLSTVVANVHTEFNREGVLIELMSADNLVLMSETIE